MKLWDAIMAAVVLVGAVLAGAQMLRAGPADGMQGPAAPAVAAEAHPAVVASAGPAPRVTAL